MPPARLLLCLLLAALPASRLAAQIYADVTVAGGVTGTFTITLVHTKAPAAAANFIGLATGQRPWLDLATGAIRHTPFYDGVTFHRVVKDFVSQTGSRNGQGTDGPGYKVRDEIDPTLHHDAYAVAMANSGKNTNGSQFYICDGPQLFLDGGYTIFGRVTDGHAICDQINDVPVAGSTPTTPVVIQSVSVYGPSLAAFPLTQPLLPTLHDARPLLKKTGTTFTLDYERRPFSEYFVFESPNLTAWTRFATGYAGSIPFTGEVDATTVATGTQHFFRFARADYSTAATADVAGNSFRVANTTPAAASQFNGTAALNAARIAGTFTFDSGGALPITAASLTAIQPYTATLYFQLSDGRQFRYFLQHSTATAGAQTGQTSVAGFANVSGTFTVAP